MKKKRSRHTGKEKVAILRKHFIEKVPVSDLCEQYGVQPTNFYRWQKQFFEQGEMVFVRKGSKKDKQYEKRIATLEQKIKKKNDVMAELMEEHVDLKKSLGEA